MWNALGSMLLIALIGVLALMRVCGRSAPDRGRTCTPDQTLQYLQETGEQLGRVTALQLTVLGVVVTYVAIVIWLWRRKRSASRE
ncbi:hypothetical protein [Lysobacter soli]|uniref:hypothetical protein n=1 Tax=Lysobacter soli TaxID=453783 RepID=UPI0018DCD160|nr:hypothetical protein [Lysobacter soli]